MSSKLLKISKNKIYVANNDFVDLTQTNFPKGSIKFRLHLDTYFEIELSNYDLKQKSVEVKIIDYSPENILPFNQQKLKKTINKLIFKELEWSKLEPLLMSYQSSLPRLIPNAFSRKTKHNYQEEKGIKKVKQIFERHSSLEPIEPNDEIKTHKINFKMLFSEVDFHLGYVSTTRTFEFHKYPIKFEIHNIIILPEYNYIKNYFSNYYKSKSFNVSAKITIKGDEILSNNCHSKIIENIDNEVIDNVKIRRILNLSKIKNSSEKEKSIFTVDEILSKLDNSSNNIFNQSDTDILDLIIKLETPRSIKQLEYLAGKKHKVSQKIRFTLNPLFGFVFFIVGNSRNHICWELLDSHATYLWSYDKSLSINSQIDDSELNINTIREIGRKKYRDLIKTKQIDNNSVFNVINHSKSNTKDDFEIWKDKLETKLI
jgi:hypothetical protein